MGNDNILFSNVLLDGYTTIGNGNKFYHSAVIGTDSQDLKDKGEITRLQIGNNNTFREFCTVNKSATPDESTIIGDNCLLMAYTHVGHNCQLGNNIVLANTTNLAGHCHINDYVVLGGFTGCSQFVRIGAHCFVGAKSAIAKDIPPFTRGAGYPYKVIGINSIGLERRGFSEAERKAAKNIYKLFYRSKLNVAQALEEAEAIPHKTVIEKTFIDFVKNSQRGIVR
jgi:UDP-N-acetylglucosamine acyltransferase